MTLPLGVRLKLDRARKQLRELEAGTQAYLDSSPFHLEESTNAKGPLHVVVRVRATPPPELGMTVGDALHNARSACELVKHGGGTVERHTAFPTADNAESWAKRVRRLLDGAADRSIRPVLQLAAHRGGDDLLWALHQPDIEDKHKILLPFEATMSSSLVDWGAMVGVEGVPPARFALEEAVPDRGRLGRFHDRGAGSSRSGHTSCGSAQQRSRTPV